MTADAADTLH